MAYQDPMASHGVFTPNIAFGGSSTGVTYSAQVGEYTQIGNIVYINIVLVLSSKGAQTGVATFTGLPITIGGAAGTAFLCRMSNVTLTTNYVSIGAEITAGTIIQLVQYGSGQPEISATNAVFANTTTIGLSGFYFIS